MSTLNFAISNAEVKRAAFSGATGDVVAVAAVPGKKIRCLHYCLTQDAAGTVEFTSGAGGTSLSESLTTTVEFPKLCDSHDCGLFETAAGAALVIASGTAGISGGYCLYQEV